LETIIFIKEEVLLLNLGQSYHISICLVAKTKIRSLKLVMLANICI
jgi:hypothetical protein